MYIWVRLKYCLLIFPLTEKDKKVLALWVQMWLYDLLWSTKVCGEYWLDNDLRTYMFLQHSLLPLPQWLAMSRKCLHCCSVNLVLRVKKTVEEPSHTPSHLSSTLHKSKKCPYAFKNTQILELFFLTTT